jgi:hypothetical protein
MDAKCNVAQVPNNYATVLVPEPQLKVHLYCEFFETLIKPPAPLCVPLDCVAPLNHPVGVSSVLSVLFFI